MLSAPQRVSRLKQYEFTEWLGALCPTPDGKIIVIGNSSDEDGAFTVARLLATGELDTSFNEKGYIEHAFNEQAIFYALSAHLETVDDPEGSRIFITGVLFGERGIYPAAARCFASGALDSAFAEQGLFVFHDQRSTKPVANFNVASLRQHLSSLGIARSGAMPLANGGYLLSPAETGVLLKLTSEGTLDTTFANEGVLKPREFEATNAILLDKRIYITGYNSQNGVVAAYSTRGQIDEGFGESGMVSISARLLGLSTAEDGHSLNVVGVSDNSGTNRGCLARLKTDGTLTLKPIEVAPPNREADSRYVVSRTDHNARERIYVLGQSTEQNRDARYYAASRHADGTLADDFPDGLVLGEVSSTVLGSGLVGANELALCGYTGSQGFVAWHPLAD